MVAELGLPAPAAQEHIAFWQLSLMHRQWVPAAEWVTAGGFNVLNLHSCLLTECESALPIKDGSTPQNGSPFPLTLSVLTAAVKISIGIPFSYLFHSKLSDVQKNSVILYVLDILWYAAITASHTFQKIWHWFDLLPVFIIRKVRLGRNFHNSGTHMIINQTQRTQHLHPKSKHRKYKTPQNYVKEMSG